jgi:hypothetical protein
MEPRALKRGEIVQISPTPDAGRSRQWADGCLMVVTDPKPWGAHGYIATPHRRLAWYRCKFEHMEPTGGSAVWVPEDA